jgi:hypothetical protein
MIFDLIEKLKAELHDKDLTLSSFTLLSNEIISHIFNFLHPLDMSVFISFFSFYSFSSLFFLSRIQVILLFLFAFLIWFCNNTQLCLFDCLVVASRVSKHWNTIVHQHPM